jgi:error-prone DNA polymerase
MNNQPMGFYSPAVIIEDARRHGLRVKPIDIQVSDWPCSIEHEDDHSLSLRLGLGYVRGLRSQCAEAIVKTRAAGDYKSVDDLVLRVPQLNRKELALLANVGALNSLDGVEHRRDALWQIERAGKQEGPLLMQQSEWLREETIEIPLLPMTAEERLVADYAVSSVTTGPHPMWFRRKELDRRGYLRAMDLAQRPHGAYVRTAGLAIVKQRPGTASGVVFLSVSDETGVFNVFVAPDFFEQNRRVITTAKFLAVEGPLQKEGPIIHVMAKSFQELSVESQAGRLQVTSHDFH